MDTIIKQLLNPEVFNHPVNTLDVKETHISWVILTGDFAYKIKKNIVYDFIDYSNIALRKKYCHDELRLNRKLAKDIYLKVVPVVKTKDGYKIDDKAKGEIVDWAIQMHQFSQDKILKVAIQNYNKNEKLIKNLAQQVADFHQGAAKSPLDSPYGTAKSILQPVNENFVDIKALINNPQDLKQLEQIESWTIQEHKRLLPIFKERKAQQLIKECHGDMHLGNITLLNDQPVIFDCIEFNEYFRWLDVMAEVAFLAMDLTHKNQPQLANLFINEYLNLTHDYNGLEVLPFYIAYRALVRGKIALFQRSEEHTEEFNQGRLASFRRYLSVALQQVNRTKPSLALMHGVSGSGKSFISDLYVKYLGFIRIRSDIVRKHLLTSSKNQDPVVYSNAHSNKTYDTLLTLAQTILKTGYNVVVDATFLKQENRQKFFTFSQEANIPCVIISCFAPQATLEKNIEKRKNHSNNVSDATLLILKQQLLNHDPLSEDEKTHALIINTKNHLDIENHISAVKNLLAKTQTSLCS